MQRLWLVASVVWFVLTALIAIVDRFPEMFFASAVFVDDRNYRAATWDEMGKATGRSATDLQAIKTAFDDCQIAGTYNSDASRKAPSVAGPIPEGTHRSFGEKIAAPDEMTSDQSGCDAVFAQWYSALFKTQDARNRQVRSDRLRIAEQIGAIGLGVPLAVLLIGHGLAWAVRGLRAR